MYRRAFPENRPKEVRAILIGVPVRQNSTAYKANWTTSNKAIYFVAPLDSLAHAFKPAISILVIRKRDKCSPGGSSQSKCLH